MAITYNLISSVTLSGTSTISFTSIPQTFTDLLIKLSVKSNGGSISDEATVLINGIPAITPTGNSTRILSSAAAKTSSGNSTYIAMSGENVSTSSFSNTEIYFPSYTQTGIQKLLLANSGYDRTTGNGVAMTGSASCTVTAAITSISFGYFSNGGTAFRAGSTAYLYGISKA
jgi:hypothetical protein